MHELGILRQVLRIVENIVEQNGITAVRHITLEVGDDSGIVPLYLNKLFPVAVESFPEFINAELRIMMTHGRGLVIKDIGYQG